MTKILLLVVPVLIVIQYTEKIFEVIISSLLLNSSPNLELLVKQININRLIQSNFEASTPVWEPKLGIKYSFTLLGVKKKAF